MELQILYDLSFAAAFPNVDEEINKILAHTRTLFEKPTLNTKFQLDDLPFLPIDESLRATGDDLE